jgi:hypothetical protein
MQELFLNFIRLSMNVIKVLFVSLLLLSVGIFYFRYNPSEFSFYPKCFFHELTGYDCPGCGSQRAIYSLLHFDFRRAADQNLLIVLCIPALIVYYSLFKVKRFRSRSFLFRSGCETRIKVVVIAVIVVFWILRNLPYYPFALLASD